MTTRWQPDTHTDGNPNAPTVILDFDMVDGEPVCVRAVVNGVEVENKQEVFDQVVAENRLKNRALKFVEDFLPASYKKPLLDSDGDVVEGQFVMKNKYPIVWDFGKLGDGVVSVFVENLNEEDLEPLKAALQAEFGDTVVYER